MCIDVLLSFNVLPTFIQESWGISEHLFNKDKITISIKTTGPQPMKSLNRIYCEYCNKEVLPGFLEKYKSGLGDDVSWQTLLIIGIH